MERLALLVTLTLIAGQENERSRRRATTSYCPSVHWHYHYESVTIPVGGRATLTCGESGYSLAAAAAARLGEYTWYWVSANGSKYNVSVENRTISADGKRNGTTGHYECHYGATFVDRFYIMVRGQESRVINIDCTSINGYYSDWFSPTDNNASDWSSYIYVGYFRDTRECEKDFTVPCFSVNKAHQLSVRLPMCACAERPTKTFICGLKKALPNIVFDPTCWQTMISIKYRYIGAPTTTDVTTAGTLTTAFSRNPTASAPLSTTPTTNPTTTNPTNSSVTVGLVVGIAIAAVFLVVVLVVLCFSQRRRLCVWIRRRKPTAAAAAAAAPTATTSGDDLTDDDLHQRNLSMSRLLPAAES